MSSMIFNTEQVAFMKKIGLNLNFLADLSDDEYVEIEEKVADYLQKSGFDANYEPTKNGRIAESILDLL